MPRQARQRRILGIHHVVVQGKRLDAVFKRKEDKELYWDTVLRYREKTGVKIYAFCILENHAHLVLQETDEVDVSGFMRRVGVSYAYWYRQRHPERKPGCELFRGRYRSEPVESEHALLEVVRYVHQEPVRQGLAQRMEDYPWSSYRIYVGRGGGIDRRRILDSLHFSGGCASYMEDMERGAMGHFLEEVPVRYGRSDEEAKQMVQEELRRRKVQELSDLDSDEQRNLLRWLRDGESISISQLARVTGVNRGYIQRL